QLRIVRHHIEARTDVRREIDFVDDQYVGLRDARAILAGNLVAGRDVDDVNEKVDERRTERQRQIVAAAFDQDDVGVGKSRFHVLDRGEIHARILAYGGMWTSAGLHAENAFRDENALQRALNVLRVLGRHDVVGDDQHLDAHVEQWRGDR